MSTHFIITKSSAISLKYRLICNSFVSTFVHSLLSSTLRCTIHHFKSNRQCSPTQWNVNEIWDDKTVEKQSKCFFITKIMIEKLRLLFEDECVCVCRICIFCKYRMTIMNSDDYTKLVLPTLFHIHINTKDKLVILDDFFLWKSRQ